MESGKRKREQQEDSPNKRAKTDKGYVLINTIDIDNGEGDSFLVPEHVFYTSGTTKDLASECKRAPDDVGYVDNELVDKQREEWKPFAFQTGPLEQPVTLVAVHSLVWNGEGWFFSYADNIQLTEKDDWDYFARYYVEDYDYATPGYNPLFNNSDITKELFYIVRKACLEHLDDEKFFTSYVSETTRDVMLVLAKHEPLGSGGGCDGVTNAERKRFTKIATDIQKYDTFKPLKHHVEDILIVSSESNSGEGEMDDDELSLPDYSEVEEWVGDSNDPKVHELWESETNKNWFRELCDYFQSKTRQAERELIMDNIRSSNK